VDVVVGRDADEVLVEGPVVDRAEAQVVADPRLPAGIRIADDVSSIQKP
jgi:hypothetical protein